MTHTGEGGSRTTIPTQGQAVRSPETLSSLRPQHWVFLAVLYHRICRSRRSFGENFPEKLLHLLRSRSYPVLCREVCLRWWFWSQSGVWCFSHVSNDTALKWTMQLLVLWHHRVMGNGKILGCKMFFGHSSWCDSNNSFQFSWLRLGASTVCERFFNYAPVLLASYEGNSSSLLYDWGVQIVTVWGPNDLKPLNLKAGPRCEPCAIDCFLCGLLWRFDSLRPPLASKTCWKSAFKRGTNIEVIDWSLIPNCCGHSLE